MNIIKQWIWPIVAGFVVASVIMLFFEWINHFIFPKPEGLDLMDPVAIQTFTASLPWTAYILVFVGWAVGAFEGGCTTAWLAGLPAQAGEKPARPDGHSGGQFHATAVLTALLVVAGIFDMKMLGFPMVFTVLGLIILGVFPFLGRLALNTFERKKRASMAKE